MTQPAVGSVALELYDALSPLAYDDERQGYALLLFGAGFVYGMEEPDDWSRDRDDLPGWGILLDVDQAPAKALPWLAQFVGVTIPDGEDEAAARQRIRDQEGFKRGTVAAMVAAAQRYLTGARNVVLRERYDTANPTVDSPYHLTIYTFTSQTPDSAKVLAALMAQKPAGLKLNYQVRAGQDWQAIQTAGISWTTAASTYPTWADMAGTI